jgi:hypothetical protein
MFNTSCIELSSFDNVFAFDTTIFNEKVLPLLDVYNNKNNQLREHIKDGLSNASKFYSTPQNIEIFTNFCLQLGITSDEFTEHNFIKVKKHVLKKLHNRVEFSILDIIKEEFSAKNIHTTPTDCVWFADAPQSRGHDKIGSGEILFSFFCGGCKPDKGDVSVEHVVPIKFELKGKRGRLLETDKILISEKYKDLLLSKQLTIDNILHTVFVITGIVTNEEGIDLLNGRDISNTFFLKYKNDVLNALIATNCVDESDMFKQALLKRWPRGAKSAIRALCGALQLTVYKKELSFDYIVLTDNATPFACKGFSVADNVLANTLTLLHNNINIQQSLDGKGYQISFEY